MAASNEVAKLQQHLELLREQYIRLQQKHAELEQKYTQAVSTTGDVGPDHFVTRLLSLVANLHDKPLYSDIILQLSDRTIPAHRFVLNARSTQWNQSDENLLSTESLDLTHLTPYVASILIRWVYTDSIILPQEQSAIIELLSATNKYKLNELKEKCEEALISVVTVRNCIRLYQTSEEHSAQQLKKYCLQVISSRWNDLDTSDFADLTAPLLYDMFKAHSSYPLHLAIQHMREDVVFMFIIEHNLQLPHILNECDEHGNIPLNLALLNRHEGIANTLVSHKCDLDVTDKDDNSLLHLAIMRGDIFAASFLIKNGASTILCRRHTQETPLHLVATYKQSDAVNITSSVSVKHSPWPSESMATIASLLLQYHANPDAQDSDGNTPLQQAIVNHNTDVFSVLLSNPVLNLELRNRNNSTALWLALKQLDSSYLMSVDQGELPVDGESFAAQLIKRGADPDAIDTVTRNTLLHLCALESNESAAIFLVRHGGGVNNINKSGEAPIHIAAIEGLHILVKILLQYGADPNLQTNIKPISQPLVTVSSGNNSPQLPRMSPTSTLGTLSALSSIVSENSNQSYQLGGNYDTGLSSLQQLSELSGSSSHLMIKPITSYQVPHKPTTSNPFGDDSDDEIQKTPTPTYRLSPYSSRAGSGRSSPTTPHSHQNSVSPQPSNPEPHIIQEFIDSPEPFDIQHDPGNRTALHLAIIHNKPKVVDVLLEYKNSSTSTNRVDAILNLALRDASDETPLSLALWTGQFEVALKLLDNGADIECPRTSDGMSLLYQAIVREQCNACLFLLNHGANFKKRTSQNETLLLVAIRHQLESVADRLCDLGSEVGVVDSSGNSPLWVALRSRQETIASKLISHGCDPNAWHTSLDGTSLSLLHRAILLNDSITACFLIKSGADINSPTKPAKSGNEFHYPIHMANERGLSVVVQCLVDHHADLNTQDFEGRTPLHVAISTKHPLCSEILLSQPRLDLTLRDRNGQTPFAAALAAKDNATGQAILKKEPKAAEQMDNRGQNFLHLAVLNQDVESVIFLLSVNVDVNSKVQNPTQNTPLHYAIKTGSEIIVRHLLLAMADINATDNHDRGVLHLAVEGDFSNILSVLLENSANPDHVDEEGNNALHIAMQLGHINCVQVLLEDSDINLGAVNVRGRKCLHMLASSLKDNKAAMFHMLLGVAPNYPLDNQDNDGNTPLLLAYFGGSTNLCDSLIQKAAHPGMSNKQNVSIFNAPVATKQLLFRILDQIQLEPSWLDGQFCMECNTKFNISHRKHHCRHCGRLLCNKCTSQQMPIVKFDLIKPVRVCEICADSFRLGNMR